MKKIKYDHLEIDKPYLIFLGYEYSPSGYEIGIFNLSGDFELQSGAHIPAEDEEHIYSLPVEPS